MTGKVFVDSNVLVYLFSKTEPKKKTACAQFISKFNSKNQLVWSTQVIQEFYSAMTRKYGEDPLKTKESISAFDNFELVVNDRKIIEHAIDIQIINQLSFWDSLIISSALSSKCDYLLTEDLQKNQIISGLQIVSPFE